MAIQTEGDILKFAAFFVCFFQPKTVEYSINLDIKKKKKKPYRRNINAFNCLDA